MDTNTLHRFWLDHLRLETEHLLDIHGIALPPPNLELNHSRRVLGQWRSPLAAPCLSAPRSLLHILGQ